ncbi:MAG: type II CAAX prenyl endopeptidase Rce1 family protein [Anaerolineae bacterium]
MNTSIKLSQRKASPTIASPVLDLLRRHPLGSYFVLAYALQWGWELPMFAVRHQWYFGPWLILSPTLAAFLMAWITDGRAGVVQLLRRCVSWRVGIQWFLVAVLAIPMLFVVSLLVMPGGLVAFRLPGASFLPTYLLGFLFKFFAAPFTEEPGWRGFAQPRMQAKYGPLAGTLMLGLWWGAWHLPFWVLIPGHSGAGTGLAGIGVPFLEWMAFIMGFSVLIAWVFNHTHMSVLLPMLLHASINITVETFPGALFPTAFPPAVAAHAGIPLWVEVGMLITGAVIVVATRGRLGYEQYLGDLQHRSAQSPDGDQALPTLRAKEQVRNGVSASRASIVAIAHDIHERPELAFSEHFAAVRITDYLAERGFRVTKGTGGLATAFVASIGNGPLHIALCAEYDALPPECIGAVSSVRTASDPKRAGFTEIWLDQERSEGPLQHGCGHNIIAGAAVAAAIGLAPIVNELGLTVSVYGAPGEELVGLPEPPAGHFAAGKISLFQSDAFDGVHAVLMVHPGPTPWSFFIPTHVYLRERARFSPSVGNGRLMDTSALRNLEARLQQALTAAGLKPTLFVGRTENRNSGAQVDVLWTGRRERDARSARKLVLRCFEAAASQHGATVQVEEFAPGTDMKQDPMLSASFRRNSEELGRVRGRDPKIQQEVRQIFRSPRLPTVLRLFASALPGLFSPRGLFMDRVPAEVVYGTDLANVSHVIPAIHPSIGIGGLASNHTVEFAAQTDSEEAYQAMIDGGIALAWTAVDAATDPAIRDYLLVRPRQS